MTDTETGEPEGTTSENATRKPVQLFLLHAIFLTLLFSALPLRTSYELAFRSVANAAFSLIPGDRSVEIQWIQPKDRSTPSQMLMSGTGAGGVRSWEAGFSINDRGRIPSAAIVALVLATPLTPLRQAIGCVAGLAIFHTLLIAQLGIIAWGGFASAAPGSVPLGDLMLRLAPAAEGLFRTIVPRFVAVFVSWAAVASPGSTIDASAVTRMLRGKLSGGSGH